jgi:hypothetical protein
VNSLQVKRLDGRKLCICLLACYAAHFNPFKPTPYGCINNSFAARLLYHFNRAEIFECDIVAYRGSTFYDEANKEFGVRKEKSIGTDGSGRPIRPTHTLPVRELRKNDPIKKLTYTYRRGQQIILSENNMQNSWRFKVFDFFAEYVTTTFSKETKVNIIRLINTMSGQSDMAIVLTLQRATAPNRLPHEDYGFAQNEEIFSFVKPILQEATEIIISSALRPIRL